MDQINRRNLIQALAGATVAAVPAAALAKPMFAPPVGARVPGALEFQTWKKGYKLRYKQAHSIPQELLDYGSDAKATFVENRNGGGGYEYGAVIAGKDHRVTKQALRDVESFENTDAKWQAGMADYQLHARARGEGYFVGSEGRCAHTNPNADGSDEFYCWYRGWLGGRVDFQRERGRR